MGWSQLILVFMQIFGPFLKQLLQRWLDKKLHTTADAMASMDTYADEGTARDQLFECAIRSTWNPFKRVFLRRLQAIAEKHNITCSGPRPTLDDWSIKELAAFNATHDEED
jgi:hypothetical protein